MSAEPTVLDFVKALLTPWRGTPPPIPPLDTELEMGEVGDSVQKAEISITASVPIEIDEDIDGEGAGVQAGTLPWRAFIAFGLAIVAQLSLEPAPGRSWGIGLGL